MEQRRIEGNHQEYWSEREQVLRRRQDQVSEEGEHGITEDPKDYSAIGGPEDQRQYGRTRSDTGNYPFGQNEAAFDRDIYGTDDQRGGYQKVARPHPDSYINEGSGHPHGEERPEPDRETTDPARGGAEI